MNHADTENIGLIEEKKGVKSSRRFQAILFSFSAIGLYYIGALKGSMPAVYAGIACTTAAILFPVLTTAQEIQGTLIAAQGVARGVVRSVSQVSIGGVQVSDGQVSDGLSSPINTVNQSGQQFSDK